MEDLHAVAAVSFDGPDRTLEIMATLLARSTGTKRFEVQKLYSPEYAVGIKYVETDPEWRREIVAVTQPTRLNNRTVPMPWSTALALAWAQMETQFNDVYGKDR